MKQFIFFVMLFPAGMSWSQDTIREKPGYVLEPLVSESMAQFPGGDRALRTFVLEHLLYPPALTERKMLPALRCLERRKNLEHRSPARHSRLPGMRQSRHRRIQTSRHAVVDTAETERRTGQLLFLLSRAIRDTITER
jgi:hypothetical protein